MDQNSQLTFSDDPLLIGSNEVYQLIEEGRFSGALKRLDKLMDINPDYPGLIEEYRTAKFWNNRREEMKTLNKGKQTADFLMREWNEFDDYAKEKKIINSFAYKVVMRYTFFTASEHYKIAFQEQESTTDNFDLLLNLGICFLTLEEYRYAIETLEYAHTCYKNSAKLLAILGEAYFHIDEIPKSIFYFREAFFIDPSDIDLNLLKSKAIQNLIEMVKHKKPDCKNIEEWIPIFGFIEDTFYVKKNLNSEQIETIKREIYRLEKIFRTLSKEEIESSNIKPRLINKYLWMLDYFNLQNHSFESIEEIKRRLNQIDKDIFMDFFKKKEEIK